MLKNVIFARASLQTVTITGNSKNLYTCCTNKTALFQSPVVTVSYWTWSNAAMPVHEHGWTEGADCY